MSVLSSYTINSSNFQLNGGFYQDVTVSSASFDQIYLVILANQLDSSNTNRFTAAGTTNQAYSFIINVIDVQNAAYFASPNVVQSLMHIEEPYVVVQNFTISTLNANQSIANYKIETSSTIFPPSSLATQFTVSFTPSLQGIYTLRSSAFSNGATYTIVVNDNGAHAPLSYANLTIPVSSQTNVNAGSTVELTLTLKDTLGNDLSTPGACSLAESYYYSSSDSTKTKVANLVYSNLKLTAPITTAGTFTLVPVLTCVQGENVEFLCEACQVTVLAQTNPSIANSVVRGNNGASTVSVVQGNEFVGILELRDQYGNAIADSSGVSVSSAWIKNAAGTNLVQLANQRLTLTQNFLLFISDPNQISTYLNLIPRTGYYQVEVQISGSTSGTLTAQTFDLVPSDYTAPPIGAGTYNTYYRKAQLINPEGSVRAGTSAILFLQLRTANLVDEDEDKTSDISLLFFEDNNGSAGTSITSEAVCKLESTKWAGANSPGIYFLNFRCTTSTNKWLRLRMGNTDDRNDIYLPMKADSGNLSLVMSDSSLYQDSANRIFNPAVTRVPFTL